MVRASYQCPLLLISPPCLERWIKLFVVKRATKSLTLTVQNRFCMHQWHMLIVQELSWDHSSSSLYKNREFDRRRLLLVLQYRLYL